MKARLIVTLFLCLFLLLSQGVAEAVMGSPDVHQAATLIVPFMERDMAGAQNTLVVADCFCTGTQIIHWELWDIDGNRVGLYGNQDLTGGISWVSDFATILSSASPAQLTQLTVGSVYRGFLTIDLVTASTPLPPTDGSYPFSNWNCIQGWIYYVRLLQGAANGIPMIHIEAQAGATVSERGLYDTSDAREELDAEARYWADNGIVDPDNKIDLIMSRIYQSPPEGTSRIVVWTWRPSVNPTDTPGSVPYYQESDANVPIASGTVNLNHIVNVIDVTGTQNGIYYIQNIPADYSTYVFSFNTSFQVANPALTWEAMFQSTILPEFSP